MKKIYFLILFFSVLHTAISAQAVGNEWIKYSQPYYKFPITKTGIYRITPTALANSGANFGNVNPRNFQVFGRGKELPIFVKGENDLDGIFNGSDYIEFYAQRNDGWLDSLVYDSTTHVTNPYYSLFTDTAFYFLTWNTTFSNLRMTMVAADTSNSAQFLPEPFFMRERLKYFSDKYYQGESDISKVTDPEYTNGEGWMSQYFGKGNALNVNFKTGKRYPGGPPAT